MTFDDVYFTPIPELYADFDLDGDVDSDDCDAWQAGFGTTGSASHGDGDSDGDSDVDGNDFLVWQRKFGVGSLASAAIPEPSAFILCMLLTFVVLVRRQYWRRQM